MIISYAKYIGYSVTEPSPEFIEVIHRHGIKKPLERKRQAHANISAPVVETVSEQPKIYGYSAWTVTNSL